LFGGDGAEKGQCCASSREEVEQGLKPKIHLIGVIGLTEVRPLLQGLPERSFSAACKGPGKSAISNGPEQAAEKPGF
jgi:hypothetical protein